MTRSWDNTSMCQSWVTIKIWGSRSVPTLFDMHHLRSGTMMWSPQRPLVICKVHQTPRVLLDTKRESVSVIAIHFRPDNYEDLCMQAGPA